MPKPTHRIFAAHPTINSELLHYVKHGKIKPKPDIAKFDGHQIHFVDGSVEEFDTVICATGYYVSFPFLPPGLVPVKHGNLLQAYAGMCLPDYKNLYIVGTMQPRYGFGPLITRGAELIARLILLQDQMELPLGLVMKEAGQKLPESHLINPHALLRELWLAQKTLPLLLRKERKLRTKLKAPLDVSGLAQAQANPDLRVY